MSPSLNRMHLTKSNIFIVSSISFAIGIAVGSFWFVSALWLGYAMAFLICASFVAHRLRRPYVTLLFASLSVACLGVVRVDAADHTNEFLSLVGKTTELYGHIVSDIDVRPTKQLFYFRPDGFRQNILVTTTLYVNASYGDYVLISDKVELPENFEDFNYIKFLEKDNVYALMRYPKSVLVLKQGKGNAFARLALFIKRRTVRILERRFSDPEQQLLFGILIGAKRGIPDEIHEQFNRTGLSHIVAVSGYNISVIITALAGLARYVGRRWSFWLSFVGIITYVIMTGASSSVIRAGIMGVLLLLSFSIGRLYYVGPSLACAAVLMLVINPKILVWDVGFQLSFLATLGIVLLVPLFTSLIPRWQNPAWLKATLLATLAAILSTAPLIAFQFERLSLIAPLANVLVLPAIPAIMLFGFASLAPIFGSGFAFIAEWLLTYVLATTRILSQFAYASIDLKLDAPSMAMGYVTLVLAYVLLIQRTKKNRKQGRLIE